MKLRPLRLLAVAVCRRAARSPPAETTMTTTRVDDRRARRSRRSRATITVFAAASLTDAFDEVGAAFEDANPDVTVEFNFAGSSALREQILPGPPPTCSHRPTRPTWTRSSTAAPPAIPRPSWTNQLEIAVPAGNPGGVAGLDDFADADLLIGLCAEEVPCGEFGREALANAGVTPSIDTNEPDVRSLLTKVEAGELDAGIVYVTDVLAAGDAVEGIEIPADENVIATYPIAALDRRRQRRGGRRVRRVRALRRRPGDPRVLRLRRPVTRRRRPRGGPRPGPAPWAIVPLAAVAVAFVAVPVRGAAATGAVERPRRPARPTRRHRRPPAEPHHRVRGDRVLAACSGSRWRGCSPAPGSPAAPSSGRSSSCRWCCRRSSAAPRCCSRSAAGACSAARSTTRPGSCCPSPSGASSPPTRSWPCRSSSSPSRPASAAADPRYEDAAATLGASRWTIFRRITLPHAAPSIIAGAVLCWARALGEFGATVTFAGNLQGRTQTMPLAVFLALESDRDAAIALSLVLIAVSLAVLLPLRDRWLAA